jgi:hypothetical protein
LEEGCNVVYKTGPEAYVIFKDEQRANVIHQGTF